MNYNGICQNCKSYTKSSFACIDAQHTTKVFSGRTLSINYKRGQDIFTEGAPVKGVFCVQHGKIKVYKACEQRNLITELAGDGDLIGYSSLFSGAKYIHSARCLEDSYVCFIPQKVFTDALETQPRIVTELLKRSSYQARMNAEFVKSLKCRNTMNRIACALMEISKKFGLDDGKCINVKLTRKDISELSGTTTESAIRILNEFRKEKVITLVNGRIKILDNDRLMQFKTLPA